MLSAGKNPPKAWLVGAFIAYTLLITGSRWYGIAGEAHNWDEWQFLLGVRDYCVCKHHPHPPGYPIYILAGKLFHLVFPTEWSSLVALNVVSSVAVALLIPLVSLGLVPGRWDIAFGGGLLQAFFPLIWFYNGKVLSENLASLWAVLGILAFLGRERLGPITATSCFAVCCALEVGTRTPYLLLLAVPGVALLWEQLRYRRWTAIAAGGVVFVGILGATTVWMFEASGDPWSQTLWCIEAHGDQMSRGELGFLRETPFGSSVFWEQLAKRSAYFALNCFLIEWLWLPLSILAVIGAVRIWRGAGPVAALTAIVPTVGSTLLVILTLYPWVLRYFVPGFLLFGILIAAGIDALFGLISARVGRNAVWLLSGGCSLAMAIAAFPAIQALRSEVFPVNQAIAEVARRVDPEREAIVVTSFAAPHFAYTFPEPQHLVFTRELPRMFFERPRVGAVYEIGEATSPDDPRWEQVFRWSREREYQKLHRGYLAFIGIRKVTGWDATRNVLDVGNTEVDAYFVEDGFTEAVASPEVNYRWTRGRASVTIPSPRYILAIDLWGLREAGAEPAWVRVLLNGEEIQHWTKLDPEEPTPLMMGIPETLTLDEWSTLTIESTTFTGESEALPEGELGVIVNAIRWI